MVSAMLRAPLEKGWGWRAVRKARNAAPYRIETATYFNSKGTPLRFGRGVGCVCEGWAQELWGATSGGDVPD